MDTPLDKKPDLLKRIEELLVGILFVLFRFLKTTLIYLVRPRYLVEYLRNDIASPNGTYILSHHQHIVRPMTYATLCSICFYVIATLLLVRVESGVYGIPSINMPDVQEVGSFISLLADKSLSQIILFQLPYVAGIVISGCLIRLLLNSYFWSTKKTPFHYLTSMYLCGYFFGVSLLLVSICCLFIVTIAYFFSNGGEGFIDYIMMALITIAPFMTCIMVILMYVQCYRLFRQLSGAGRFRCIVAAALASGIFVLTMSVGILFIEI